MYLGITCLTKEFNRFFKTAPRPAWNHVAANTSVFLPFHLKHHNKLTTPKTTMFFRWMEHGERTIFLGWRFGIIKIDSQSFIKWMFFRFLGGEMFFVNDILKRICQILRVFFFQIEGQTTQSQKSISQQTTAPKVVEMLLSTFYTDHIDTNKNDGNTSMSSKAPKSTKMVM